MEEVESFICTNNAADSSSATKDDAKLTITEMEKSALETQIPVIN